MQQLKLFYYCLGTPRNIIASKHIILTFVQNLINISRVIEQIIRSVNYKKNKYRIINHTFIHV